MENTQTNKICMQTAHREKQPNFIARICQFYSYFYNDPSSRSTMYEELKCRILHNKNHRKNTKHREVFAFSSILYHLHIVSYLSAPPHFWYFISVRAQNEKKTKRVLSSFFVVFFLSQKILKHSRFDTQKRKGKNTNNVYAFSETMERW